MKLSTKNILFTKFFYIRDFFYNLIHKMYNHKSWIYMRNKNNIIWL